MIKKLIWVAAALFCSVQALALGPVHFGLKGGVSFQDIDLGPARAGSYDLSTEPELGFHAGMMARVSLRRFYIQPEINYVQNQYKLTATAVDGSSSHSNVKMESICFPILLGARLGSYLRVEAGPTFNLWNQCSTSAAQSNTPGAQPPAHFVLWTRPSVGYVAGLVLDLGVVNVSGRYIGEFSRPAQTISIGDESIEVQTRVHTWDLGVGFSF